MKEKLSFQTIIQQALHRFPEYERSDEYEIFDPTLAYPFFSGLTQFFMKRIIALPSPLTDKGILEFFDFVNEMMLADDEVVTLAVVEVLENLVQENKSKEIAMQLLGESGKKYLSQVLNFTGVD